MIFLLLSGVTYKATHGFSSTRQCEMPTSLAYAAAVVPTKYRPLHRPAKASEPSKKLSATLKQILAFRGITATGQSQKKPT